MPYAQGRADANSRAPRSAFRLLAKSPLALGAAILGAFAAGCTTTASSSPPGAPPRPIVRATQQPLRDLNVLREATPEVLQEALRAPYAAPDGGCPAARAQSLRLDAALGPDVDAPTMTAGRVQAITAEAIRSVAGLPYRGVVRKVSGAAAIDEARSAAVLAGMVRRGYLKGLLEACGG